MESDAKSESGSPEAAGRGRRTRERRFSAFLIAVSCLLSILVVLLALQNRQLKATLAAGMTSSTLPVTGDLLQVGDSFDPFGLRSAQGELSRLDFEREVDHTLLLIFAGGCTACTLVYPSWERLERELSAAATRVVAIKIDTEADPKERSLSLPAHSLQDMREVPFERLTTVPSTILLDRAGRIEWLRYGTLAESDIEELLSFVR